MANRPASAKSPLMRRVETQHGASVYALWVRYGPPGGYSVKQLAATTQVARRTWENWAKLFGWPWEKGGIK